MANEFRKIKKNIKAMKNNLLAIKADAKRSQELIQKVESIMAKEKLTVEELHKEVESLLPLVADDAHFNKCKEDYIKNREFIADAKAQQAVLEDTFQNIKKEIQAGDYSDKKFEEMYAVQRDLHEALGKELALIDRLASSGVVFLDAARKVLN